MPALVSPVSATVLHGAHVAGMIPLQHCISLLPITVRRLRRAIIRMLTTLYLAAAAITSMALWSATRRVSKGVVPMEYPDDCILIFLLDVSHGSNTYYLLSSRGLLPMPEARGRGEG
jgi:hypothetical protein